MPVDSVQLLITRKGLKQVNQGTSEKHGILVTGLFTIIVARYLIPPIYMLLMTISAGFQMIAGDLLLPQHSYGHPMIIVTFP